MSQLINLAKRIRRRAQYSMERRVPRGLAQKIHSMPPIKTDAASEINLAVLATEHQLTEAMWSAYSLLMYAPLQLRLTLIVDVQRIDQIHVSPLQRLFPQATITTTYNLASLAGTDKGAASHAHPLFRKLASLYQLQCENNLLYADCDVLAFSTMNELKSAHKDGVPLYVCDSVSSLDDDLLKMFLEGGYPIHKNLNSGFLYIPVDSWDRDILRFALDSTVWDRNNWFTEQTTVASLMAQAKAKPLPSNRYILSTQRQFYDEIDCDYNSIVLRHFTSPVRHLMYRKGYKRLYKEWARGST